MRLLSFIIHNSKNPSIVHLIDIYGKTGGVAPESEIMEFLKFKCLPCLYCGLEACPVNKSLMKSLEVVPNDVIRKIFVAKSNEVVSDRLAFFSCVVSDAIYNRESRMSKLK